MVPIYTVTNGGPTDRSRIRSVNKRVNQKGLNWSRQNWTICVCEISEMYKQSRRVERTIHITGRTHLYIHRLTLCPLQVWMNSLQANSSCFQADHWEINLKSKDVLVVLQCFGIWQYFMTDQYCNPAKKACGSSWGSGKIQLSLFLVVAYVTFTVSLTSEVQQPEACSSNLILSKRGQLWTMQSDMPAHMHVLQASRKRCSAADPCRYGILNSRLPT